MLSITFYLYLFVSVTWFIYISNSIYQNHRMKKFVPNKTIEVLTIPFYIFFILSFYLLIQKMTDAVLTDNKGGSINFNSFWVIVSIITGIILCFSSVVLFIYANFFEESFPSCITTKSNKPLRGIYKYIRHPSYYIFFFITFGNALCLLNLPLFILACINHICLYIYYMIEENQIRKTNPDYDKYLKRSNRFLPNFLKITTNQN
jgi:protein-S-isoprenylcysteine O-methyltransferase Ste14